MSVVSVVWFVVIANQLACCQNLQNFLETSESAFLVTTGSLTISMAASFASVYTYFRLKKML